MNELDVVFTFASETFANSLRASSFVHKSSTRRPHTKKVFVSEIRPKPRTVGIEYHLMKKSLVTFFSVATGGAAIVVLLYLRRKQRLMETSVSEEKEAPTEVEIVHDGGEAARAISALVHSTIGEPANISCIQDTSAESLAQSERITTWVFVVEVDKEGDCTEARKLLRALKKADANTLSGKRIAVLALARSVCSFSAASGGLDKYRGGARLQSALLAAGAWKLCQMGCAEVEMEEVEVSVLPWAQALKAVVR